VALVNPDAFVERDWLQKLLDATHKNTNTKFFSAQLINAKDHSILDGQGDCYHVSGLVWRRKHAQATQSAPSKLPLFSSCAASALYNRAAVLEVGGFDESYFCYIEDVDLGFRLRLAGYDCQHVNEAVTYHVGSAITGRESDFAIYHGHRNLVWTYFKNMPTRLLWRYLPQHILMNLVSIAYYTSKGRPGVILKAKWHALIGLPKVLRQRASNQPGSETVSNFMAKGWLQAYFHRDA
jgi:GT2 family glycosyltransferase